MHYVVLEIQKYVCDFIIKCHNSFTQLDEVNT
jgi:hypothetical protein